MEKYIPVPEENFFSDYLELEAQQKVITRNDLDTDLTLHPELNSTPIDYQTLVVPILVNNTELNLIRELYNKIKRIKDTFEFSDETEINKLLDDIQEREYELDETDNIQELSEMYVYNQNNRFNNRPFMYKTEKHNTIDKNAIIDMRMFEFGNLNLNYYAVINPRFINKAYLKNHKLTLPYGIFWCKLETYNNKRTTIILDNCKSVYFYHTFINGKPTIYSYSYNNQKIYLCSNNFAYEYRTYNDKQTLILLHMENKFVVYDKIKL